MANKNDSVKGISIEYSAKTDKLLKDFDTIKKKSKDLTYELKSINKSLKFDPTNTKLLAQKQEVLKEAIKNSTEKVENLKNQYKAMAKEAANGGKISTEELRKMEKQVIDAEQALKSLKTQSKNFGNSAKNFFKEAEKGAEKLSNKTGAVAKAFAPITAAITAVGVASVASYKEIDDGYDEIIKKTGATGKKLESLQKSMDAVYSNIPTDAQTAANAIGEVNTRFQLEGEELEKLTSTFIKYSQINNTEVIGSVANVQKLMDAYDVAYENTGDILGTLTKTSQKTGVSVDVLADLAQKNSATFKTMNFGIAESIDLIGQFEREGLDATDMLSGLKKASSVYAKKGESMQEGLQNLVSDLQDSSKEVQATAQAFEIFGAKAGNSFVQAAKAGKINLDDLAKDTQGMGDLVNSTFDGTQDEFSKMQTSMNKLKLVGSKLGATIMESIVPAIEIITEKLDKLNEWFSKLSDKQKQIVVKIGAIIAVIGPALFVISKVIASVKLLISVIGAISSAIGPVLFIISKIIAGIKLLIAVIGTVAGVISSPFVLIGAAIAGVIAAIVLLYAKCEWFRTAVNDVLTGLANGAQSAINFLIEFVTTAFNSGFNKVVDTWNGLTLTFALIWDNIKITFANVQQFFSDIFSQAAEAIKKPFIDLKNFFNDVWSGITSGLEGALSKVPVLKDLIGTIKLPAFANGGVLGEGMGIVAEAGPELIQVKNGKAVITPLTGRASNTRVNIATSQSGKGGINVEQNLTIVSPKAISPSESSRLLRNANRELALKLSRT